MIDLGILPGADRSAASDINDAGQIVGQAGGGLDSAFIWQNGTMTDLNDLISDSAGVHVVSGNAINNQGEITGTAVNEIGHIFAVLLTPIQPPGDLSGDCSVGIADFLLLLALWGPCPNPCPPSCAGVLDGDCVVGIADFLTLLGNWG